MVYLNISRKEEAGMASNGLEFYIQAFIIGMQNLSELLVTI